MQLKQTTKLSVYILLLLTATISTVGHAQAPLKGSVSIDGSSTVFPISEAVAEEFLQVQPKVRVTVGVSGTGGGFKKFLAGETDINDASRPIKPSEAKTADAKNLSYLELPVAYDGLSVLVNKKNDWVNYLTVGELKKIWHPNNQVKKWSDVRPNWPDKPIKLYGPGSDSGTFDYFTEVINGKSGVSRPDYTASEDDNILVQGINGDKFSLGFFGFAYYKANKNKLKLVPIDGGNGPIKPSPKTINDGSYQPLSRPIFIYLNTQALNRPEVKAFAEFYLENAPKLSSEVGYIPLPKTTYRRAKQRLEKREAGTAYQKGAKNVAANLLSLQ